MLRRIGDALGTRLEIGSVDIAQSKST